MNPIYLDNNATTPLDEEVLQAMLQEVMLPLNPSSVHTYGMHAKQLLKNARGQVARCLGVHPEELFFTSGGTESLNMLIRGLYPQAGKILTTSVEHASVHNTITYLKQQGASVTYIPVGAWGAPTLSQIQEHLDAKVALIVLSAVYSETGVKLDLNAVAALAEQYHIPLVIDAVALLGKELFQIPSGVSGMAFSSHKLHGPKGVGAAYLAPHSKISPLLYGGHQEQGLRPGTEPLQEIIGFAKALQIACDALPQASTHMRRVQQHFESTLKTHLNCIEINGEGPRVCNTSNIAFHGIDGETLLLALDRAGIYASMGSACSSGAIEPSRVLLNMGFDKARAKSSLRFSFSRKTTLDEIDRALSYMIKIAKQQLLCSLASYTCSDR